MKPMLEKTSKGFTYKSYNFVDKDPIIDEIRTVVEDSGEKYARIEDMSGVSANTMRAWFEGATRRPQAATINAVLRALGYKLGVVRMKEGK
jgi:transcriptional regulator with XRE-family HTH domain